MHLVYAGLAVLAIITTACIVIMASMKREIKRQMSFNSRYNVYYKMLNQWIKNNAHNKRVSNFLLENSLNTIAIYGVGEIGLCLYEELKQDQFHVSFFVDSKGGKAPEGMTDIKVMEIKEISMQEKVDAIIVTPVYNFESIYNSLVDERVDAVILSLEDIIYTQKCLN